MPAVQLKLQALKVIAPTPCRADRIRTCDPYVPNVVRYRAALLPEKTGVKNTRDQAFIKKPFVTSHCHYFFRSFLFSFVFLIYYPLKSSSFTC